jgi:hypothetical protein
MSSPSNPAVIRPGYQAPGPFGLNVTNIDPPVPLYIRKDEILQVVINNSVAGIAVALGFRMMMADGQVVDSQQTYKPTSDRAINTFTISMEEGYLLSVIVTASSTPGKRGQTFVQIQQGRGNKNGLITPTALLIQDYVGSGFAACWPNGRISTATEGAGRLIGANQASPAAGANFLITVPANARWALRALTFTLTCSAAVATRNMQVQLTVGGQVIFTGYPNANATASQTWTACLLQGGQPMSSSTGATSTAQGPLPITALLGGGDTITSRIVAMDASDQLSAINYEVEEWIEP